MLNSPFFDARTQTLAGSLSGSVEERVTQLYRRLLQRAPNDNEVALARDFLRAEVSDGGWRQYVQVLLGSNEFMFVD